jgi:glycosyltransferase involved in cell wall biosynthesis
VARKILFVNTVEPVVPLYREVFPVLRAAGFEPEALVSACHYREEREPVDALVCRAVWTPRMLRKNRRWCALFYFLIAPLILLTASRSTKVVFLTQPPLFYLLGGALMRLKGNAYYLHVMDLYPELLEAAGWLRKGWVASLLHGISRWVFAGARRVIVIGRCMQDVVQGKMGQSERIAVVENLADRRLASSSDRGEGFRKEMGLEGKLIVLYSGNMGMFHSFDAILEVARRLRFRSDIAFVFVGKGVRRKEVEAAIEEGAENIILLGHQSPERFADIMAAGDLHFISLREEFDGLLVPSKLYGSLAVGRPVVFEGSSNAEIARVIEEEACGTVVPPGTADELERQLLAYATNRKRIELEGARARRAYTGRYRPEVLVERYVQALL